MLRLFAGAYGSMIPDDLSLGWAPYEGAEMKMQLCLAVMGCAALAGHAVAGTREDVLAAMQRCSVMPDDRTWLDCTYGAQQIMRAKLGLPPAPAYQQRLVPPGPSPAQVAQPLATKQVASTLPPTRRKSSFWQILGGSAPPVAVSSLSSVTFDSRGAFIATLENGQIWREADAADLPKPHLRIGTKVTITPGVLSSYNLRTEDNPHSYKVERQS
jgi:hypothetical protein